MNHLKHIVLATLLFLTSCTRAYIPASNAFYVNDMANALLSSTKYYVYANSKNLHDVDSQTKAFKDAKISGTQIVVATYLGGLDTLNSTTIFNEWQIGDNDMGIFLLLYFAENPDDKYTPIYRGMTREIGAKMAGYISMFRLEQIFNETWENPVYATVHINDYDYKLIDFYSAILNEVYTKVYGYSSFAKTALLDDYAANQYESFYDYIPKGNTPRIRFSWWFYVLIGVGAVALFGGGGFLFTLLPGTHSSGGGGKSRGYKYTR